MSSKTGNWESTFSLVWQVCLVILAPLNFYVNFKSILLISTKEGWWAFNSIEWNLQIELRNTIPSVFNIFHFKVESHLLASLLHLSPAVSSPSSPWLNLFNAHLGSVPSSLSHFPTSHSQMLVLVCFIDWHSCPHYLLSKPTSYKPPRNLSHALKPCHHKEL